MIATKQNKKKRKKKERAKRGVGHMWLKGRPNVITCNHVTPIMNLICDCGRGDAKFSRISSLYDAIFKYKPYLVNLSYIFVYIILSY